jgi:biopolymer transport protein ExbD
VLELRSRSGGTILACAIGIAILAGVFASTAASAVVPGPARAWAGAAGPPADRPPAGRPSVTRRGIVQALSAKAITLKELDGTTLSVSVDAKTRVFVNGKPASLREVKPGFAAIAKGKAGKPARELRTFDLSGQQGPLGAVVKSASATAVVLNEPDGSIVTVVVDAKTHVFIDGKPASLSDVEPGFIVVTSPKAFKSSEPAKELRFLRPG